MPLGIFGGGSSSKPQPLSASEDGGKDRKEKRDAYEKDIRGTVLKLSKTTVTIDKKLAEGGFAIVYLVSDKQNRQFALKRQFVNDDLRQVEACKRECQIISSLRGHKNIVCYVDHLLTQNKNGIYDYMLLTVYYKNSVLQWMNERLASGRALSSSEVLSIFCDMCEAVARLHHSQTPVIHRDLKVENILIDDRNRAAPPSFVLCDFGSATTRVLSSLTHPVVQIQEEIEKYTTLSYRSPEMIDLYEGKPIGTKSDCWAMGVMLYKLCYFSLPFGESALSIQNGTFSFPSQPSCPDAIKAIIKCLLDADIDRRPSIYQCASLAFEAASKECPVNNVFGVAKPSLSSVIAALKSGKQQDNNAIHKASSFTGSNDEQLLCSTSPHKIDSVTTSVNPRLRPKPTTSIPAVPSIPPSPKPAIRNVATEYSASTSTVKSEPELVEKCNDGRIQLPTSTVDSGPLSCPLTQPSDLGFTDLEDVTPRIRAQTEASNLKNSFAQFSKDVNETLSTISLPSVTCTQTHRRNMSDTSHLVKSAFKPYSETHLPQAPAQSQAPELPKQPPIATKVSSKSEGNAEKWNPFLAAPFEDVPESETKKSRKFREIRQDGGSPCCSDSGSIDSLDPFGAAPFDPLPSELAEIVSELRACASRAEALAADECDGKHTHKMSLRPNPIQFEEDSELDEQRMKARRRYSYENIDGVGEEGSSDSRGRTEGESTDDLSRNEESSHDEENEHSQLTDVVSDDGGGRPLLEDDGLEDDYEDRDSNVCHDVIDRYPPLSVDPRTSTNPFINSDLTPKISPADPSISSSSVFYAKPALPDVPPHCNTIQEVPLKCDSSSYAPATLPRQVTPLTAVKRIPQRPVQLSDSVPEPVTVLPSPDERAIRGPIVGTLIQVASSPEKEPIKIPSTSITSSIVCTAIEGPKTPLAKKTNRKKIDYHSSGSEFETDGSEAEMFASSSSDKNASKKKKKQSPFTYLGSNSVLSDRSMGGSARKAAEKRKTSTSSKRGSAGALNASFVNSSFQAEEIESASHHRPVSSQMVG